MRIRIPAIALIFILIMAAGCASAKFTKNEQFATGKMPKPAHIWVLNFSAAPAEVPANSALAGHVSDNPQTEEDIEAGQKVGAQIAEQLVREIRDMGLPAMQYTAETTPRINDLIIQGHLISITKGSKAGRVAIGFGAGASELSAAVEQFQVTPDALRPLSLGNVESRSGKKPGTALGAATFFASAIPAGLIIGGAVHIYQEASGHSTIKGRAKQAAQEIAASLKKEFQEQGWI